MPPMRMHGPKAKNPKQTLIRLLSYMKPYRVTMVVVLICILANSLVSVVSNKSLEYIIDDYIRPLIGQANPDFLPLIR